MVRTSVTALVVSLVAAAIHAQSPQLVSYLPFDNDSLANAVNSNYPGSFASWNETVQSGQVVVTTGTDPTFVPGIFGTAVQFTGATSGTYPSPPTTSGNFVSVPGGGGLNGLASTTISMWVEWNGTQPTAMAGDSNTWGQYGCVLGRRQVSGSFDPQIGINGPDPSTCEGLRYGCSTWMDGNNTPNDLGRGWGMPQAPNSVSPGDGVWVNVVTTFDSSGDVTMYMNGVLLRSVLDQPLANLPSSPLTIGAYYATDQQWGPSNSTVDDFGIFNTNIDGGVTNGVPNNTGLVAAIYNLGVSNLKYDLGDVSQLFTVYGNQTGTATVNGLNWTYATGLSGGLGVLQQSGGNDYVQLDSGGGGVEALASLHPGDANGDGRVDINDLTIVLTNFGQTGCVWSQGCMDGDPTGTVDINDLTIVLSSFGMTYTAAGIEAVPEPSTIALLLASAACRLAFAWRNRA
jgi:hypothetical protein